MAKKLSMLQRFRDSAQALLEGPASPFDLQLSRLQKFLHFWVLVGRSFNRNRCPVRASALAYATLLALIPMLAVVVSVTSTFLKKEGEDRIDAFSDCFAPEIYKRMTINFDSEEGGGIWAPGDEVLKGRMPKTEDETRQVYDIAHGEWVERWDPKEWS